jgi:hypothetical protein
MLRLNIKTKQLFMLAVRAVGDGSVTLCIALSAALAGYRAHARSDGLLPTV